MHQSGCGDEQLRGEVSDRLGEDCPGWSLRDDGPNDGTWCIDLEDRRRLWLAPGSLALLGWDGTEVTDPAAWWQERILPEDARLAEELLARHCEDPASTYDHVARYRHRRGHLVWIRTRGAAIRDARGKALLAYGTHNEMMSRRSDEANLERIFQGLPANVLACDRASRIGLVSDAWLDLMGYGRDEVMGRALTDFIDASCRGKPELVMGLRRGETIQSLACEFVTADGECREHLVSAESPGDARGLMGNSLLLTVDVTDQRNAEALAARERRIRMRVLECAPDAIFVANASRAVVDANPAAARLFGYPLSELKGESVARYYARHEDFVEAGRDRPLRRGELGGESDRRNMLFRRKDGSTFVGETVRAVIWDDDGTDLGKIGIVRDVTQRERYRRQLEESNHKLSLSLEVLDQFAYVASHDLRTPLRGIRHIANFLEEDCSPEVLDALGPRLGQLRERVEHMDHMLVSLLEYARRGHDQTERKSIDLGALLDRVESTLRMGESERKFTIERELDCSSLEAQATVVDHILSNLLSNAVMHHDGAHARITVCASTVRGTLRLTVEDDGPGIPERHHERVFEIFRTLGTDRSDPQRGGLAGMGLALVRRLAIRAGGTVEVTSPIHDERGCRFEVSLPIAKATE